MSGEHRPARRPEQSMDLLVHVLHIRGQYRRSHLSTHRFTASPSHLNGCLISSGAISTCISLPHGSCGLLLRPARSSQPQRRLLRENKACRPNSRSSALLFTSRLQAPCGHLQHRLKWPARWRPTLTKEQSEVKAAATCPLGQNSNSCPMAADACFLAQVANRAAVNASSRFGQGPCRP